MSKWAEILWGFMIWDFMNSHKISAHSDHKQKGFIPKNKFGMLVFETLKNKKNLILWIVTRVSARDYTVTCSANKQRFQYFFVKNFCWVALYIARVILGLSYYETARRNDLWRIISMVLNFHRRFCRFLT